MTRSWLEGRSKLFRDRKILYKLPNLPSSSRQQREMGTCTRSVLEPVLLLPIGTFHLSLGAFCIYPISHFTSGIPACPLWDPSPFSFLPSDIIFFKPSSSSPVRRQAGKLEGRFPEAGRRSAFGAAPFGAPGLGSCGARRGGDVGTCPLSLAELCHPTPSAARLWVLTQCSRPSLRPSEECEEEEEGRKGGGPALSEAAVTHRRIVLAFQGCFWLLEEICA